MSQEYTVDCKSRIELRELANILRDSLKLTDRIKFPIVELLDIFSEIFPTFSYEIVEDRFMPSEIHADTNITSGHIRIKERVYDGACDGNGRDRMTIAHEICHYVMLCALGFRVHRSFGQIIKPCEDPEGQAKCMAGELMIDKRLTKNMNPLEIAEACGVSIEAARYQFKVFRREV